MSARHHGTAKYENIHPLDAPRLTQIEHACQAAGYITSWYEVGDCKQLSRPFPVIVMPIFKTPLSDILLVALLVSIACRAQETCSDGKVAVCAQYILPFSYNSYYWDTLPDCNLDYSPDSLIASTLDFRRQVFLRKHFWWPPLLYGSLL